MSLSSVFLLQKMFPICRRSCRLSKFKIRFLSLKPPFFISHYSHYSHYSHHPPYSHYSHPSHHSRYSHFRKTFPTSSQLHQQILPICRRTPLFLSVIVSIGQMSIKCLLLVALSTSFSIFIKCSLFVALHTLQTALLPYSSNNSPCHPHFIPDYWCYILPSRKPSLFVADSHFSCFSKPSLFVAHNL